MTVRRLSARPSSGVRRRRVPAAGLVVALALVAAGCGSDDSADGAATSAAPATTTTASTAASTTAAPATTTTAAPATTTTSPPADSEAFVVPPADLAALDPGALIRAAPIDGAPAGAQAFRILYASTAMTGDIVAVSGMAVVPAAPAPAGGRVVLSWAHGTTGSADICAPSTLLGAASLPALGEAVAAGYTVVATDYEGLGTPGPHPYLVGPSAGRGVLDAARAVRSLDPAAGARTLVWGHSQGGQAAVWAGQIAPEYAADVEVLGVVAVAPAARLSPLAQPAVVNGSPIIGGFVTAGIAGAASAYPELDPADLLTPEAVAALGVVETECITGVIGTIGGLGGRVMLDQPLAADWAEMLTANDAGAAPIAAPLLVTQGGKDTLVTPDATDAYVAAACATGTPVELRSYPDADHGSVMEESADALAWMAARVAGQPATSTC
jgi:pimeloyl-ACP methyl ester carboxylesterase